MKRIEIPITKRMEISITKRTNIFEIVPVNTLLHKFNNNIELSKEDLISLYDIYNVIRHNLTKEDKNILSEILSHRNIKNDMAMIFDCDPSSVTDSIDELEAEPDKYVVLLNNLRIDDKNIDNVYPKLRYISGNCEAPFIEEINNRFPALESIGSHASFRNIITSEGLENLRSIGGGAMFGSLLNATGLVNLEYIGDFALFNSLVDSQGLENLKYIGGNAYFNRINDTYGLQSLLYLGGESFFNPSINQTSLEALRVRLNIDSYHRKKVK